MDKLTQKQENYVLNLFQGMSQREAYIQAGYSQKQSLAVIDRNASVLAKSNKVLMRLEGLRQEATDASIASVLERKQILSEIVRGRMSDFVEVGADGAHFNVGPEQLNSRAVSYAKTRTISTKEGELTIDFTSVSLHNPIDAIKELNKMDGIYSDSPQVNINNIVNFQIGEGYKD